MGRALAAAVGIATVQSWAFLPAPAATAPRRTLAVRARGAKSSSSSSSWGGSADVSGFFPQGLPLRAHEDDSEAEAAPSVEMQTLSGDEVRSWRRVVAVVAAPSPALPPLPPPPPQQFRQALASSSDRLVAVKFYAKWCVHTPCRAVPSAPPPPRLASLTPAPPSQGAAPARPSRPSG